MSSQHWPVVRLKPREGTVGRILGFALHGKSCERLKRATRHSVGIIRTALTSPVAVSEVAKNGGPFFFLVRDLPH